MRPTLLALSRQNWTPVRTKAAKENLSARGAYRLKAAGAVRRVILLATGSEVEIALGAAERLEAQGIGADVVSMPSTDRFDAQDEGYREDILPDVSNREILRVSVEAGRRSAGSAIPDCTAFGSGSTGSALRRPRRTCLNISVHPDAIASRVVDHMQKRDML
jgi:transketolase